MAASARHAAPAGRPRRRRTTCAARHASRPARRLPRGAGAAGKGSGARCSSLPTTTGASRAPCGALAKVLGRGWGEGAVATAASANGFSAKLRPSAGAGARSDLRASAAGAAPSAWATPASFTRRAASGGSVGAADGGAADAASGGGAGALEPARSVSADGAGLAGALAADCTFAVAAGACRSTSCRGATAAIRSFGATMPASCGASCSTPTAMAPMVAAAASGIHQRCGCLASGEFDVSPRSAADGAMRGGENRAIELDRRRLARLRAPRAFERGVAFGQVRAGRHVHSSRNGPSAPRSFATA